MKNNRWVVFVVCSLLFTISMLYRASTVVIAPDLVSDLGLSPSDLGLLSAVFFYAFGVVQIPLGFFLDRLRPRRVMIFLNLIGCLGALIFSQADGLAGGVTGRALLGLGMAPNVIGALTLYTVWFKPRQFATVSGLTFAVGAAGGLLAATPLRLLVDAAGWRFAFMLLALINFLCTIAFILMVRDRPQEGDSPVLTPGAIPEVTIKDTILALAPNFSYFGVSVMSGLRYGVYGAIQSLWAGPFLIFHLGLPIITAANLVLMINLGFIVGGPVGGIIVDRYIPRPKLVMLSSLAAMAASVGLLVQWPGPYYLGGLAVNLFLFGFFGGFAPIAFVHIRQLVPVHMSGRAFAGTNFFAMMGSGLFLQIMGGLLEKSSGGSLAAGGDYSQAMLLCFGAMMLAFILYSFTKEGRPEPASVN